MFSYEQECYKGTAAYDAAKALPVILENGRKVFGPPPNFTEPRPTYLCELYVTRIPQHLNEFGFLVWLHRIGPIYEFRLMMDTGNATRGYAFIRFCTEEDALAAFELLKYLFVSGERLSVFRSQGKNRLFISGIPRQIPTACLEDSFKQCFPKMQSCTAYAAIKSHKFMEGREDDLNRGFAFIEFNDHELALAAKKKLTPGRIRMWGVDLKVQWAKPKEEMQMSIGLKKLYGPIGPRINSPSYHFNDYCAKLRLYCLANNMCIPIVLYGPYFRLFQLQYAGILLKNNFTGSYYYFIFEIMVARMSDIHLLMCELAVKVIEKHSGQLREHTLFRVLNDNKAEMVYTFKDCEDLKYLNLQTYFKNIKAINDIATSLQMLGLQNSEKLLLLYKRSFLTDRPVAKFCLDIDNPLAQYCAILPKFRNNTKLNNNFNDLEITLLQILSPQQPPQLIPQTIRATPPRVVSTNLPCQPIDLTLYQRPGGDDSVDCGNDGGSIMMNMLQQPKVMKNIECFILKSQHGYGIKYMLRYVDIIGVELRQCYHPEQRFNSNPIWIAGQSYQKSIYN